MTDLPKRRRILVARIKALGLPRTTAAAHGPHSHATDASCQQFWEKLPLGTERYHVDATLTDANATNDNRVTQRIGDYGGPQEENRAGAYFHECILQNHLAAVNAAMGTSGPTYTHKGTKRGQDGFDHTVLPRDQFRSVPHCRAIGDIDMHRKDTTYQ